MLRSRDLAAPVADPVGAVHVGMRRRRRAQRLQVLTAGLGVVAVVMGTTLLLGNPLAGPRPVTPAVTQEPDPAPRDVTAVPAGFRATDLSFVTTDHGWALGTAPCGAESCTIQLVTTDGGATWARRPASGLPRTCSGAGCVAHVRFADSRVGYAYGPSLYLTTDGGAHWSPQATSPVFGLEIAGGTVSRVVARQDGCPGCTFVLQTSDVGSAIWHTAYSSSDPRSAAALVRHGTRVAAALLANPAGGAGDAHALLVLSSDSGDTWQQQDDPCGPVSSNAVDEVDTRELSYGPEGQLVALCVARQADAATSSVRLSTDSGRTFGPARPLTGAGIHVAAVSADRLVAQVLDGSRDVLLLSSDGGRTWTEVAHQAAIGGRGQPGFLAFSTARVGTWVSAEGTTLWRSTDGGATWTEHPFG